jgi:hypothetical protein
LSPGHDKAAWPYLLRHAINHPEEHAQLAVGDRIPGLPTDEDMLRWYAHHPDRALQVYEEDKALEQDRLDAEGYWDAPEPDEYEPAPWDPPESAHAYADRAAAHLGIPAADVRMILRRHGRDLTFDRIAELYKENL